MVSSRSIKPKTTEVWQYPPAVALLSPLKVLFLAIFKIKFCVAHRILPTYTIKMLLKKGVTAILKGIFGKRQRGNAESLHSTSTTPSSVSVGKCVL